MKLKFFLLSFIFVLCTSTVSAKGVIFYSEGETVAKVLTLPQRDEFLIQDRQTGKWYHADLGIMHEQFSIFWIPLFNYGTEKYVLYSDIDSDNFLFADLDSEEIAYLQSQFGGISSTPELPFWDAWGGKLLALVIIGGIYLFYKENQ